MPVKSAVFRVQRLASLRMAAAAIAMSISRPRAPQPAVELGVERGFARAEDDRVVRREECFLRGDFGG